MTRKYTNKFLQGMEEELIDPKRLAQNLLSYMSEDEVEEFARSEDYFYLSHEEEEAAE